MQILQKNKKVGALQTIVNWYKKITGMNYEENFDLNEFDKKSNDNFIDKNKEKAFNQKIQKLKETILNLTEKKNYYKSKVKYFNLIYIINFKCKIANEKLKFVLDKFNQADKLEQSANNVKINLAPQVNKQELRYDSGKDANEEEYNDFEENISVDSKNWK